MKYDIVRLNILGKSIVSHHVFCSFHQQSTVYSNYPIVFPLIMSDTYSELCQTSKMELL